MFIPPEPCADDILKKFVALLRAYRADKNMTQLELANKIGMSVRSYQRLEAGENEPSLGEIYRLSVVLGLKIDELFKANDVEKIVSKNTSLKLEKDLIEISDSHKKLNFGRWELDHLVDKLTWSDSLYEIFEIDKSQFKASYVAFLDLVHPEDRALVDKCYTDSLSRKTDYEVTHRLLMPDGRVKYILERCLTKYCIEGKPVLSSGYALDITELQKSISKQ